MVEHRIENAGVAGSSPAPAISPFHNQTSTVPLLRHPATLSPAPLSAATVSRTPSPLFIAFHFSLYRFVSYVFPSSGKFPHSGPASYFPSYHALVARRSSVKNPSATSLSHPSVTVSASSLADIRVSATPSRSASAAAADITTARSSSSAKGRPNNARSRTVDSSMPTTVPPCPPVQRAFSPFQNTQLPRSYPPRNTLTRGACCLKRRTKVIFSAAAILTALTAATLSLRHYCINVQPTPTIDFGQKIRQAARDPRNDANAPLYPVFKHVSLAFTDHLIASRDLMADAWVNADIDNVLAGTATAAENRSVELQYNYLVASGAFEATAVLPQLTGALRDYPPQQPLIATLLPEIGGTRAMVRFQTYRLMLALQRDDTPSAVASLRESLAATRILAQQGLLLDVRLELAARKLLCDQITRSVSCGHVSPDTARELLAVLIEFSDQYPLSRTLGIEQNFALDLVQYTYTNDGSDDGRMISQRVVELADPQAKPSAWINTAGFFTASRKSVEDDIKTRFANRAAIAALPFHQRRGQNMDKTRGLHESFSYALVDIMLPDVHTVCATADQSTLSYRTSMIACALLVYHEQHDAYPTSLAELSPLLPADALLDPFAHQGAFVYQPTHTGYALWSTGTDGDFDHGIIAPFDIRAFKGELNINGDILLFPQ